MITSCDFNPLGGSKSHIDPTFEPGKHQASLPPTIGAVANVTMDENDVQTIPFTIGQSLYLTINLFDALGRVSAGLASGNYEVGSFSANLDVSKLTAGIYYLRMKAGEQSFTKTIVVSK